MGWKNVKSAYRIGHIVQVTSEGICIGSGYIHDLIVLSLDGAIVKRYAERGNEDLARYQSEMDADPARLRELVASADTFEKSVPVYTYDGASIIEKQCEEIGWPNVTHDGMVMYENTFSTDKAFIVEKAKQNAKAGIAWRTRAIETARAELEELNQRLAAAQGDLERLEAEFPQ